MTKFRCSLCYIIEHTSLRSTVDDHKQKGVTMRPTRLILVLMILVFLVTTLSVSGSSPRSLPAVEPWHTGNVDASSDNMGQYVSIAHDPTTSRAFISYYDAINQDLRMAYQVPAGSGNCGTNNAWQCVTVDSDGDVGKYSSIDVVYVQKPYPEISYTHIGISYYDETNDALKYASGYYYLTLSWTIYEVEDAGGSSAYGRYSSIKFTSDHRPHIAYHYSVTVTPSFGGVKYASYIGDGTGNCGDGNNWYCNLVDGMSYHPEYGTHISLDLDYADKPHIAYYDPSEGDLIHANFVGIVNDTCMNPGWYCEMVAGLGDVGKFVSMHAPDNATDPYRFVYYDSTEGKIRYAVTKSGGGYDKFAIDTVGAVTSSMGLSLAIDKKGEPVVAYMKHSYGGSDLMIARPASAYGNDAGNCGDIPPGSFLPFLYWQCEVIDPGGGFSNKALFADVSVDSSGLAMVAYFSSDIFGRLRVAWQQYTTYLPLIFK